jgi:hypothetical protein
MPGGLPAGARDVYASSSLWRGLLETGAVRFPSWLGADSRWLTVDIGGLSWVGQGGRR